MYKYFSVQFFSSYTTPIPEHGILVEKRREIKKTMGDNPSSFHTTMIMKVIMID